MRTLHVIWAPRLSGAEVLVKDLAIHQRHEGHEVCVTALFPEHADFVPMRTEMTQHGVACAFPARRQGLVGKLWHLQQAVNAFRPDVIFAHATIPAFYVRALPVGAPVVYVMHSATNDFGRALFKWVERCLSRRASAVIGVSPANLNDYRAAVRSHPLMTVIPNGVDTRRFAMTHQETRHDVPALPAAAIVQLGRYTSVKDQMQTVRAFHDVLLEVPDAHLALYGVIEDAAYYDAIVRLVRELGIGQHVTVGGPRSDVPELLSRSTVFAMPSRSEGHSIAFLEALASGIPIVASTIEPFAFAARQPGVQLVDTTNTQAYARALVAGLRQRRSKRDLRGLTLTDTAARYTEIAQRVIATV